MRLIETEGRGGGAEIEFEGQRLHVVDEYSPADRPTGAGLLADAKLRVVVNPHLTGPAPAGAVARWGFEPDHGWRYRAYGKIVSLRPLRADLGPLQIELSEAATDAWQLGDGVLVAIDRIVLSCSGA